MNSPWSTKGPHFINNRSLVAICWWAPQVLCIPGRTSDWIRGFPHPAACLWRESAPGGKPLLHLSTNRLRPVLSTQDCTIWVPHLHKTDLIENLGRIFHYKRRLPLCLSGTQFRLLPESVSAGLQLLSAQINAFYSLLLSKINFGSYSLLEQESTDIFYRTPNSKHFTPYRP